MVPTEPYDKSNRWASITKMAVSKNLLETINKMCEYSPKYRANFEKISDNFFIKIQSEWWKNLIQFFHKNAVWKNRKSATLHNIRLCIHQIQGTHFSSNNKNRNSIKNIRENMSDCYKKKKQTKQLMSGWIKIK